MIAQRCCWNVRRKGGWVDIIVIITLEPAATPEATIGIWASITSLSRVSAPLTGSWQAVTSYSFGSFSDSREEVLAQARVSSWSPPSLGMPGAPYFLPLRACSSVSTFQAPGAPALSRSAGSRIPPRPAGRGILRGSWRQTMTTSTTRPDTTSGQLRRTSNPR